MTGKFSAGRAQNGEFVCVFSLPLLDAFDLIDRDGGDKEDAAHLLEALMRGIYSTLPDERKEAAHAGAAQP
jgi:hypothetical protein